MTSTDNPYHFSMDDSISNTPRTRSSNRNRKPTSTNSEKNATTKISNKQTENIPKTGQQRIATRSSQKSPLTPMNDENEDSFMSNISSGFSQFINHPKKRQREDKKTKTFKRPKITTFADENQSPNDEIQAIQQVKLIYETAGGHTNLARAAATNAQILANRNALAANTTFTLIDRNHIIDDTQTDIVAIPDTLVDNDTQHNDSSWQRDIDRLMRKLEEPSSSVKTTTQVEETQPEEEVIESTYLSPKLIQTTITQSEKNQRIQTTIINQTDEIGIQTETQPSIHNCCQDVSICPCVLRYSKLERLFMEKMSRFISIVPTVQDPQMAFSEHPQKRRTVQSYSRSRRFRGRRRIINNRIVTPSLPNNESTTVEEISDETTTEVDNLIDESIEIPQNHNESAAPNISLNPAENIISTTITIEKNVNPIDELSSIEKIDTTVIMDHPSTLLISSTNNTCSTGRQLVLTTSSLDETQKSQFRSFVTRFGVSTSSAVDSSTTHIIVNENSTLVCPLTGKIIQGIARHLFIVSHRWLDESLSQETILDERPYEIRGDTSLGSDHGGMRRSRLTPSYLLEKYSICLRCSSNDCAPLQTIEQVQELVEICGGKLVKNFSEIKTIDKDRQMVLVLGINGFSGGEKKRKALLDTCQQFNVRCVNIHWLLISIAKFDIQPFDNYDINQV